MSHLLNRQSNDRLSVLFSLLVYFTCTTIPGYHCMIYTRLTPSLHLPDIPTKSLQPLQNCYIRTLWSNKFHANSSQNITTAHNFLRRSHMHNNVTTKTEANSCSDTWRSFSIWKKPTARLTFNILLPFLYILKY